MSHNNAESAPAYVNSEADKIAFDDNMAIYKHDTKKHSRIEKEEVNRLSGIVQEGLAAAEQLQTGAVFPIEEQERLEAAANAGVDARNAIVLANTALVVTNSAAYQGRGLDQLDLIQAGNIGLMNAAEKFKPELGWAFSTYATIQIRAAMSKTLHDYARNIHIPRGVSEHLLKLKRISTEHMANSGRDMTIQEMGAEMGYKTTREKTGEQKVRDLLAAQKIGSTVSFNMKVGENEDSELGDFLVNRDTPTIEDLIIDTEEQQVTRDKVHKLLANSSIKEDEREVVQMQFGLGDEAPMGYVEIGKRLGISHNKAASLSRKALAQLTLEAQEMNLGDSAA